MKAAPFNFIAATSPEEALHHLNEAGDDGMVIAGGQTLVPMMALRLAHPAVLVDINGVAEWSGISEKDGAIRIKTCTRQARAQKSPLVMSDVPLLEKALHFVGHQQTRNRGTVGGSIALGDPSAEIPLVAVALGAKIHMRSAHESRTFAANHFYTGPMMNELEPDECITDIDFPVWREEGTIGTGFQEVSQRHGNFAVVSAAVQIVLDQDGTCRNAALAIGGANDMALKLVELEEALIGHALDSDAIEAALTKLDQHLDPMDNFHGSAGYRRRVARVLTERALQQAIEDARGTAP